MSGSWLSLTLLFSAVCLVLQVAATPKCLRLFGEPDFQACRQVLQGQTDSRGRTLYTGISKIDRKSHLFHTFPQYVQAPPPGVSRLQFLNIQALPQPKYPDWFLNAFPGAVPEHGRQRLYPSGGLYDDPTPWSKGEYPRFQRKMMQILIHGVQARWMQCHAAPKDRCQWIHA